MSASRPGLDRRAVIRLAAKGAAAGAALAAGGTFAGPAAGALAAPALPAGGLAGAGDFAGMPRSLALSVPPGTGGELEFPPLPDQLAGAQVSPPSNRIPYAGEVSARAGAVDVPASLPFTFNRAGYRIVTDLPESRRPWRNRPTKWEHVTPDTSTSFLDEEGVYQYRSGFGQPGYDHPVGQIQFALGCVASYRTDPDASHRALFLTRAKAQAKRLIDRRVEARGAWWFPYPFDSKNAQHPGVDYKAPWYSGMAQGEAISLFLQLAQLDGVTAAERARYREAADGAFASLLKGDDGYPWAVHKDSAGYLWIQEYPGNRPGTGDFTYNGMIFAMLGLWDYYAVTGSSLALALYDGAATTMAHYFPSLRNTRWISHYCNAHRVPAPTYHWHHVTLFLQLHWQTGAPQFAGHCDTLVDDHPAVDVPEDATVAFAAGTHTLYRFDTKDKGDYDPNKMDAELERKEVTFARATQAPASKRRRIQGRGIYYRISAGPYTDWWVGEYWPNAFLRGEHLVTGYHHQRTVTFPGGNKPVDVYFFAPDGTDAEVRTVSFANPSNAPADRRAIVNGRPMFKITAGGLTGGWVPATSVTADSSPLPR
ncbi:D-glucuronyl C5-epimerase family protein [Streptomyces sp. ODS05-4]|uniref:D-glucuronyl C5-epimerase family protein n=1 Tax=Streptomyces sp. ODS05-4 TaxID=2944939 RepID=UPI002108A27C|nr:D-glucuronyl C5-epimerase family protein [Streptomyces sp. ODS05-4]